MCKWAIDKGDMRLELVYTSGDIRDQGLVTLYAVLGTDVVPIYNIRQEGSIIGEVTSMEHQSHSVHISRIIRRIQAIFTTGRSYIL